MIWAFFLLASETKAPVPFRNKLLTRSAAASWLFAVSSVASVVNIAVPI